MDPVTAESGADYNNSVMLCLRPSQRLIEKIVSLDAFDEDPEGVHLTLAFLGDIGDEAGDERDRERLYRGIYDFALHGGFTSLKATWNGYGIFMNGGDAGNVLVALWDVPDASTFRTRLMDAIASHGYQARVDNHGFSPHSTISYKKDSVPSIPKLPAGDLTDEFTSVWLVWGDDWQEIALT